MLDRGDIKAVIFDLDGTLVQTENLKALSYAVAVQRLLDSPQPDPRAVNAYQDVVGMPREDASRHIMEQLGLEPVLRSLMHAYGASEPRDVLTALYRPIYEAMTADPAVLRKHQWPDTVDFLHLVRSLGRRTALATMSSRLEADRVLEALGLRQELDVILTKDDVREPKPNPEVYATACRILNVASHQCLAIEDSLPGVQAALAAGIETIAVATSLTRRSLQSAKLLPPWCLVVERGRLLATVSWCAEERRRRLGSPRKS